MAINVEIKSNLPHKLNFGEITFKGGKTPSFDISPGETVAIDFKESSLKAFKTSEIHSKLIKDRSIELFYDEVILKGNKKKEKMLKEQASMTKSIKKLMDKE